MGWNYFLTQRARRAQRGFSPWRSWRPWREGLLCILTFCEAFEFGEHEHCVPQGCAGEGVVAFLEVDPGAFELFVVVELELVVGAMPAAVAFRGLVAVGECAWHREW
jgi:hypothetical protein